MTIEVNSSLLGLILLSLFTVLFIILVSTLKYQTKEIERLKEYIERELDVTRHDVKDLFMTLTQHYAEHKEERKK